MSEVEEVAKAAAEAAKFGTKALDVSEKMTGFLAKVFKEPAEQAAGIISDKLKFLRWQRQVRMADEVQKMLEGRGVKETSAISPKFAVPMLEAASMEEEDGLQDLWVKLMANAMDPNFNEEVRFTYIDILKKLNSTDVKILDFFYKVLKQDSKVDLAKVADYSLKKEQIMNATGTSEDDYYVSIYNLFGAQCLTAGVVKGGMSFGEYAATSYLGAEQVAMTTLGLKLVEAAIA